MKCAFMPCDRTVRAKGLCVAHYDQQRRGRGLSAIRSCRSPGSPPTPCGFAGCGRPSSTKGLCNTHGAQRNAGNPLSPSRARRPNSKVLAPDGFKYCIECKAALPVSDFSASMTALAGLRPYCRRCDTVRSRGRRYNLQREAYQAMLDAQGGVCATCHQPDANGRSLSVDHDHACCPGQRSCGRCIRGLLCRKCNAMLGLASDNPDLLESAIRYLKRSTA